MPTTLTLKNIPDEVYARLKRSAEMHRRSLNREALVCLEAVLVPARVTPGVRLARERELRSATSRAGGWPREGIPATSRVLGEVKPLIISLP